MDVSFSNWKVEDHLKTPEACVAYIHAAAEEGTPDAVPDAFGDVFRALGMPSVAAYCDGLAAYLRTVGVGKKSAVKPVARRARPAKRELARA